MDSMWTLCSFKAPQFVWHESRKQVKVFVYQTWCIDYNFGKSLSFGNATSCFNIKTYRYLAQMFCDHSLLVSEKVALIHLWKVFCFLCWLLIGEFRGQGGLHIHLSLPLTSSTDSLIIVSNLLSSQESSKRAGAWYLLPALYTIRFSQHFLCRTFFR